MNANYVSRGFAAIIILFAIGCADGQRQSNGTNGKGKRMLKTQGPGTTVGKASGGKTTAGTTLPTADDSTKQKEIDASIQTLDAGVNSDFTAGTYQLISASSFFNYPMPSDYVQALGTTEFLPAQNYAQTTKATLAVGLLSPKITQPTVSVGVPFELNITKAVSGQVTFTPSLEKLLTSTVGLKITEVSLKDVWSEVNPSAAPKFGLTNLINATTDKLDDGHGATATVQDLVLENGDLRFVIRIEQTLAAPTSSTVYRSFYLTYHLKVADGAATARPVAKTVASPVGAAGMAEGDRLLLEAQAKTAGKF